MQLRTSAPQATRRRSCRRHESALLPDIVDEISHIQIVNQQKREILLLA